jgi:hypothetical protein
MTITCEFPEDVLAIGTKVYIPRPALKSVLEDKIVGYYCIYIHPIDKQMPILQPTDYRLCTINLDHDNFVDAWKRNEFFLSYEDAKAAAVEYPVVVTDEEWVRAIGLCKDDDRTEYEEDCELQSCCAAISNIRSALFKACTEGKLTGVERNELILLLDRHEIPNEKPILDKILAQLHIVWKEGDKSNVIVTN